MVCSTITSIRRLKFHLSSNEDSGLGIRSDLLETIDSKKFLSLYVQPNDYQPLAELDSPNLLVTGRGSFLSVSKQRKGFTVNFAYEEANIRTCLQLLAKNCFVNKTFITVLDFISPEPEDYSQGYTQRNGIIRLPFSYSGSIGQGTKAEKTPDGFSFSFSESNLRYV